MVKLFHMQLVRQTYSLVSEMLEKALDKLPSNIES